MNKPLPFFPSTLKKGSRGPAVALLQCLLLVAGYNKLKLLVDGGYETETVAAIREFQTEVDVEENGEFDQLTAEAFHKYFNLNVAELTANLFQTEQSSPKDHD